MFKLSLITLLGTFLATNKALDNGLGLVPPMGYSSWNDCSSNVTEEHMKAIAQKLISSGLAQKGYYHVNVDEGWLKERNSSGWIVEDFDKFPSGMKGLGDWIHSQSYAPNKYLKYGLYTSRGTCQCSTQWYHGPGSNGFEVQDAQFMANAGADYIKEDSCCGSQDHETAFGDYGRMRDALNKTGRPIYFSLCGWNTWYAPVGYSLGNSWRISGDGSGWDQLTLALNKMAYLTKFNGPGGWNDPDLLIGPNVKVGGQTDIHARSQMSMWSIFPAPLIISNNLLEASNYAFETYGNEEVIAINQDPLGKAGFRAVGGNVSWPCDSNSKRIQVAKCNSDDVNQQWVFNQDGSIGLKSQPDLVLDAWMCGTADQTPVYLYPDDHGSGSCNGKNQKWVNNTNGTIVNSFANKCLDVYQFVGPEVDIWDCNGGKNQQWKMNQYSQLVSAQTGLCLAANQASSCTNVWLRELHDGSWAMAFLNQGSNTTMTCDEACFAQTNLSNTARSVVVRDVWNHSNITTLYPSPQGKFNFSTQVPGDGQVKLFRLYPSST